MTLSRIQVRNFRCIESATLDLERRYNLIFGPNGSGKTSLLEAIGFLSRGRSFRGTRTDGLVKHGQSVFQISAVVTDGDAEHRLGIEAGRGQWVTRLNREPAEGVAALAEKLAVQVIDPEIHRLVSDGPDVRRRFLDYGVFHVEHRFLSAWRRYRRALRQRNAALRQGVSDSQLEAWNPEFLDSGAAVDACRVQHVAELAGEFERIGIDLMQEDVSCEYRPGWTEGNSLPEALAAAQERDREQGTSTVGPHRADLKLVYKGRGARQQVSRGQQKLFGAALVLAQTRLLGAHLAEPPLLLVDDPAAELDAAALERMLGLVVETGSQLVVTALSDRVIDLPGPIRAFHVEQGRFEQSAGDGMIPGDHRRG